MNRTAAKQPRRAVVDPRTLLARIGFLSRGIIYLIIGASAISAALSGDRPRGVAGALHWLIHEPLGGAAAVAIAAGLACFAGWLAISGWTRSRNATRPKRRLLGIGLIGDALFYAAFVVVVLGFAWRGGSGGDSELQLWVAWVFAHTAGRLLVGLIGLGVLVGGVGMLVWAWTRDPERPLALSADQRQMTEPVSRFGVSGRGVAMILIGLYLAWAALNADPSKAHELGGIMQLLRRSPAGWAGLFVFGAAFAAAAVFDFLQVFYRRRGLAGG